MKYIIKLYVLVLSSFFISCFDTKKEVGDTTITNSKSEIVDTPQSIKEKDTIPWDTIRGFFNTDSVEDIIVSHYNTTAASFSYKVCVGTQDVNTYSIVHSEIIGDDFSSLINEGEGVILPYKTNIAGRYGIRISCCASIKEYEDYIYEYNTETKKWQLIQFLEHVNRPKLNFNLTTYFKEDALFYQNKLETLLEESKKKFDQNDSIGLENALNDMFIIGEFLENVPFNTHTVSQFNDVAYYLEKTAGGKQMAVFLLHRILQKFPKRTVAYINLGDAYWGLADQENAKKAYATYVTQMKAKGKTYKIPKRVTKRLAN